MSDATDRTDPQEPLAERAQIPNTIEVTHYLHCRLCIQEIDDGCLPDGVSPSTYARLNIGWTSRGLQVECARHGVNVMHIDFEGQKHPANFSRVLGGGSSKWQEVGAPSRPPRFLQRMEGDRELWLCRRRGRWAMFVDGVQVAERMPCNFGGDPPTQWVDLNWAALVGVAVVFDSPENQARAEVARRYAAATLAAHAAARDAFTWPGHPGEQVALSRAANVERYWRWRVAQNDRLLALADPSTADLAAAMALQFPLGDHIQVYAEAAVGALPGAGAVMAQLPEEGASHE